MNVKRKIEHSRHEYSRAARIISSPNNCLYSSDHSDLLVDEHSGSLMKILEYVIGWILAIL